MDELKKITAIKVQKTNKNRYSVFINDEFAFGIHESVLLKSQIAKGDEIDDDKIDAILELEEKTSAKEKALRLLGVRARSTYEMEQRLQRKKYDEKTIKWVIQELNRLGLLDDCEFAHMFVRSKMITRPSGPFLLRRELKQKGIDDPLIDKAISKAFEEESEEKVASHLAQARHKRYKNLEERVAKKRIWDFLVRRGFSLTIIKKIMDNWSQAE